MAVCPVDCFYRTDEGVVLHDKDLCIGCGYCFYACPFGAPQFPQAGAFGLRGKMDKCTFCAGGPEADGSEAEFKKYGRNRLAEGKLPACAEMCSTKALLGGDGDVVADIYRNRVLRRGKGSRGLGLGHGLRPGQRRARSRRPQPQPPTQVMSAPDRFCSCSPCLALAACGERSQSRQAGKRASTRASRDTLPWDNGPMTAEYRGGKWKQGRPRKLGRAASSSASSRSTSTSASTSR